MSVSLCSFCSICFVCVVYQGYAPLHFAARWGHCEVVELLIKHGANVNAPNEHVCVLNCWITLCIDTVFYASKTGSGNVLMNSFSFLHFWTSLQWFDDSTVCDMKITGQNYTPLHRAAREGHCKVVELLIECGANVNAQDIYVCSMSWSLWKTAVSMMITNNVAIWHNPLFEWLLLSVLIDQFDGWLNKGTNTIALCSWCVPRWWWKKHQKSASIQYFVPERSWSLSERHSMYHHLVPYSFHSVVLLTIFIL